MNDQKGNLARRQTDRQTDGEKRGKTEARFWKGLKWTHSRYFIAADNPSKGQNPWLFFLKKIGAIAVENVYVY